jgi:carbon monoxide dehydrogenase subunit G
MPSQTFTGLATTDASPQAVWDALDKAKTWEGISGVDDVFDELRDSEGRLTGFKFRSTAGGREYVGTATPGERVEMRVLTWIIATSEIRGSIQVQIEEAGAGTRIDVTMSVESVSMMASFGFPIISRVIGNGFQETVDNFASNLSEKF